MKLEEFIDQRLRIHRENFAVNGQNALKTPTRCHLSSSLQH